jgi:hypothetical protein
MLCSENLTCRSEPIDDRWAVDRQRRVDLRDFSPMDVIPTAVCLTTYQGEAEDFIVTPLDKLIQQVVSGRFMSKLARSFISTILWKRIAAWRTTRLAARSLS